MLTHPSPGIGHVNLNDDPAFGPERDGGNVPALCIALVTETYPPEINGVAMTLGHLVDTLRRCGHHVTVIRPRQMSGAGQDLLAGGLPIPGYPGLRFGLPAGGTLKQSHAARLDHRTCEKTTYKRGAGYRA
jgi:hypothetical protein